MVSNGMRGMPGAVAVDAAEARQGAAVRDALDGGRGESAEAGECAVAGTVIVFDIGIKLVSVANLREHWATRAERNKRQRSWRTAERRSRFADFANGPSRPTSASR